MARLGDVAKFISDGDWIESKDQADCGIRLIQTGNIGNGIYLDKKSKARYISENTFVLLGCTEVFAGDILISRLPDPIGRSCIIPHGLGKAITAVDCTILRLDSDKCLGEYFVFFSQSDLYLRRLEKFFSGTTRTRISRKNLEHVEIPLPSIEQQTAVVDSLSKVVNLLSLRKQQLAKLDELVKSQFVEMFGDPTTNQQGWDKVNISAVVGGKVSNGFFAKRDDYCDDGNVQVLGVANVVNRMYSNTEDLPKTNGTEADIAKYGVKYGDMLFCRSSLVAAGIGKASIVPHGIPDNVLFECHVIRLPLDLNKCVPEFMQVLSTTDYFRNQVIAQSKTATMTTIGQDGILKTEIILPPIDLQRKFLQFVEQTDKSKLSIQQSIDQLETLKASLMQKYFG